jgi:ERCC4-related helicase
MYQVLPAGPHTLPLLDALQTLYRNYDLRADPYVVGLLEKQKAGYDCFTALQKVFASDSTYCKQQLKSLCDKGLAMYDELGPSATQWYLCQCIYRYQKVERQVFEGTVQEEQHLSNMFDTLHIPPEKEPPLMKLDALSPKLKTLIDVLVSEASPEFTGLVFVEQRVWVVVLSEILSIHPRTKDLFNIGTFVGTSASTRRKKNVAELPQPRHQQNTLDEFRAGTKNVILATSVLEEGIDVSSCHLVICFERPKNLKSFVQRRGRARKQQSKYIIFVPEADVSGRSPENWETLEEEMKKAYLSDLRAVKLAEAKESQDEGRTLHYKVSNTG